MRHIKSILKQVLPDRWLNLLRRIRNERFDVYAFKSYSQEGEDMILRHVFEGQWQGFYVDVGAHHPRRYSNTFFFYKLGWRGINIDAMPGSMNLFTRFRPRDINLECGVGPYSQEAAYYMFNDPALNSFDEVISRKRDTGPYHIIEIRWVHIRPLGDILLECLPNSQQIDFITIDVEGKDLEVLQSNNWQRFRPKCVLIECLELSPEEINAHPVNVFLSSVGYQLLAKTMNNAIYRDINFRLPLPLGTE
jgi:hypothetical protein